MFSFDFKSGDVGKFINDFKELNKLQQTALLTSGVFNTQQNQLLATAAGLTITESGQVVATTELAASQTAATASTTGLSAAMTGLGATIKSTFIALATNPITWMVTGLAVAGVAAYNYATALDNAIEKAEESQSAYSSTASELESLKSESESYKDTLNSLADTYEIKLTGNEEISELISKLQSTDLSLEDRVQVDQIKSVNAELERQIALKQELADKQSSQAVSDAIDALKIEHTQDLTQTYTSYDRNGIVGHEQNIQTDIITATQNEISALEELKKKRQDLFDDNIDDSKQTADFESLDADIKRYTDSISSNIENLTTLRESFMEDGVMKSGLDQEAQDYFHEITKAIDDFNNIDLSPSEKALNSLNSYFDGSTGKNFIKEQLEDAAKNGKNLENVLNSLGIELSDLGKDVTSNDLTKYFKDLIKSANEASDALNKVNNNLTVKDIGEAFESENAGDNYVSLNDYIKKAKELYDQGLVGTDDFKSVAEALSYNIDSSAESFKKNYDKIKKYFTEDKDGNLTGEGINNFLNDLQSLGNGYATWNEEAGKWDINMDNTAQAAKELGVSVQVMEAILGRIKDYDNIGDFDFRSAIEDFDTAKSSLEGLRSIYDEMEKSSKKELLGDKLDNWESQLDTWENDLATLDTDVVMNIKLEYDLATIQSQIDDVQELIDGGANTVDNNAKVIAGNEKYINVAEEGTGLNLEGVKIPVEYEANENTIDALKIQLKNATSDEDKVEIQAEIENLQDIQKQLLDSFTNVHPEINADSSMEEVNAAWEEFVSSTEGQEIIAKITAEDEEAKEKVAEILGIDQEDITVEIKANDEASNTLASVEGIKVADKIVTLVGKDEASYVMDIWNSLSADPKFALLSAEDQATSVIQLWNSLTPEQKTAYMNGEISITDSATGVVASVDSALSALPLNPNANITATDSTSGAVSSASLALKSINGKTAHTYIITHRSSVGDSGLNGTVHKNGTLGGLYSIPKLSGRALAMGTLEDNSWIKSKWKTKKDDVALTGELGQEMVVHGNRWWTVGDNGAEFASIPQGSVIFNAQQTKDLLKKGFVNSRGTAHLSGTAYAGGASGSFSFGGGASKYNGKKSYSSSASKKSSTNKNNNNSSSTASAVSKAAEDLKDFVEIYLDVASDLTQQQIDAIERAVGLADKQNQNAKAITNVQSEISKNQQAYNRYMQQANSVGLSESYASQIRNGSLNIENITDETLSKNIKSYEEWYNKAKDCLDKVTELQDKERELAIERLEQIEDFYKLVTDVQEALQKANEAKLDFSDVMGFSAVSDAVRKTYQESLNAAEEIYDNLSQQLVDYQSEFNDLMSKGYIQKYSDEWYEGYAKINEFNEAISEAGTSIVEFEDKIREISYTKIQQLIDGFERAINKLDAHVELMESRDETVPESIYQKQLDANNSRITGNKEMRDAKLAEQALYAVTSTRYQELAEEINKLDTETLGLLKDNEKLKDTIFELRFTPLEDGIKKMDSLKSELKDFMNLLNEDAYFDKEGRMTSDGVAALALLEQSMTSSKQVIADYRKGLEKLQESFDNVVISEVEFNEKSEEYRKGIRDAIADVQDYSEALTDLYLTQMKRENEYLQEIIDKRKDALKAKAEYYDYDKKIRGQSKDVNMLKAQIAALEGVNNASAQAELKRLKQQLSDAEDELSETKRDHAIEMQEKGYDAMSDELNELLENTEYEIVHNADKQQSVIQSMLNNVVSMYSSAYGKINEIIHNTGWVGSTDFNTNQSDLSTQAGATNQVSNATQHQSNVSSTGTAQGTVTSPINNNDSFNQKFEQEIIKDPNTTNRPVAELKLSAKSITLEEGKSTSISVQIRPTDAKNKTLEWKSSNVKIATVSSGTIKAVKPGSCQITASTTDGSGISASVGVTVTKKPDPPKPAPKPSSSSNNGGDGVPNVGDAVTFASGRYYYDSQGVNPSGNKYQGQTVYITKINTRSWANKPYHISRGTSLGNGDLGWVTLDQIRGYNKGTKRVPKDGLAIFDETAGGKSDPGSEVIVTKYGTLKQFNAGDRIFANKQVQRLWEISNGEDPFDYVRPAAPPIYIPNVVPSNNTQNMELHIDKLFTIEGGTITKDAIPDIEKAIKNNIPMIKKEVSNLMYRDAKMSGVRKRR